MSLNSSSISTSVFLLIILSPAAQFLETPNVSRERVKRERDRVQSEGVKETSPAGKLSTAYRMNCETCAPDARSIYRRVSRAPERRTLAMVNLRLGLASDPLSKGIREFQADTLYAVGPFVHSFVRLVEHAHSYYLSVSS